MTRPRATLPSALAGAATPAWLPALASLLLMSQAFAITAPAAAPAAQAAAPAAATAPATKSGLRELDWEELIPKDARASFSSAPPAPIHDYLGEGGMAAQQVLDFSVNKDLDGVNVKLPGFIVPLDVGKDGMVSEFFLVPYFGACIHVPPPPPNQIIYVKMAKGIALDSIYEAYWITGRMKVGTQTTKLGAAAYQLAATQIEVYKY
jgi:uncharacterized protein